MKDIFSDLEQYGMEDLTGALFLFCVASLFGLLVIPEWTHTVVVFGSQAVITLGVWIVKRLVRLYLRRRELREQELRRRLE